MIEMIECLPGKREALSSNPITKKKKKKVGGQSKSTTVTKMNRV
jgi:hypothetical protein